MTRLNFLFFTPVQADAGKPSAPPSYPVNCGGDGKKSQDEGVVSVRPAAPPRSLTPPPAVAPGGRRHRSLSPGRAAALSVGAVIAGSGLAIGLAQIIVWLATGTFPAFSLGQLVSYIVGVPALPPPSPWQPWYYPSIFLYPVSEFVPAALCLLAIGGWIALKVRPERSALPPADAAEAVRQIEGRRGRLLVVVSRQRPALAEFLEERFGGDPRVEIKIDKRWGSGRSRLTPQTESAERRGETGGLPPEGADLRLTPFVIFPRD